MKKLRFKLFALLCAFLIVQSCNDSIVDEQIVDDTIEFKSASVEKTGYIVVLNDAELDAELTKLKGYEKKQIAVKAKSEKLLKRVGIFDGEIDYVYGTAIKGFSVNIPPGQLKKLENDPSVKYVEKNQVISLNVPKIKVEGDISASSDAYPWGIIRVNGGADCTGKVAWVIDSGIDFDHPDLNVDIARAANFTRAKSADDDNGHGTHCAGTIAAKADGAGVIGVAANATVVPVKVLDRRGSGTTSGVIAGVDYVAANASGNDVANMSLGGGVSTTLDAAVLNASSVCKFVLAAGNESDDADSHSPARVNGPNIYTISSMAEGDTWSYFSNFGEGVDYCEPGSSIYSTYKNGGYATMSGTSMAAPHAAGILLAGNIKTDGYVNGDPDGEADPIGVLDGNVTPPVNQVPSAGFTFDTSGLTVDFTDTSTDDGGIVSWIWDFDGEAASSDPNPSRTFSSYGTKIVSLTVSDGEFSDTFTDEIVLTEAPVGGDITLTATSRKVRGIRYVDLTWSGATGNVEIFMNEVSQGTESGSAATLDLGRLSGTFVFKVCEVDGSACSNEATVVF